MAAKLKAHNPQRAKLKSGGYIGEPTGETVLNENHKVFDVKTFANARVEVPDPVLIDKNIFANGTYKASEDNVDGYKQVNVNLPFETKTVTPKTVSQDVTVTPDTQYQALEKVTVEAAPLEPVTITPTTQQQTYTPQAPAIGFDSVTVLAAGLPIDPNSLTPLELGVDSGGFYYTDEVGGGTPVSFGRDANGLYVTGGNVNAE